MRRLSAQPLQRAFFLFFGSTQLARVVKINLTNSMPLGVYVLDTSSIKPRRIVVACLPIHIAHVGLQNGYLITGSCPSGSAPVLGYVAAIRGSLVRVTDSNINVDRHVLNNSSAHQKDRRGRRIARLPNGNYTLAPDQTRFALFARTVKLRSSILRADLERSNRSKRFTVFRI